MSERIKSPKSNRKISDTLSPKVKNKMKQTNGESKDRPLRLRIVLSGDEKIGKSCLIKRYCEKRFVSRYLPTIGIDYGATKILVDKREVGIHIFDTSGMYFIMKYFFFFLIFFSLILAKHEIGVEY